MESNFPSTPLLAAGDRICFEGDSQTSRGVSPTGTSWAYARMSNWQSLYSDMVEEWLFANLPEFKLTFRNAARGGSSIHDLEERYETFVKPYAPSLFIFTLGNNDARKFDNPQQCVARTSAYLERLQSDSPCRLLYIGVFEACPGGEENVTAVCERARPFNLALARMVIDRGGSFLNIGEVLKRKATRLREQSKYHTVYAEGRHLNSLGSEIVAGQVLRALGAYQLLEQNS